jgi:hypothetical protein
MILRNNPLTRYTPSFPASSPVAPRSLHLLAGVDDGVRLDPTKSQNFNPRSLHLIAAVGDGVGSQLDVTV